MERPFVVRVARPAGCLGGRALSELRPGQPCLLPGRSAAGELSSRLGTNLDSAACGEYRERGHLCDRRPRFWIFMASLALRARCHARDQRAAPSFRRTAEIIRHFRTHCERTVHGRRIVQHYLALDAVDMLAHLAPHAIRTSFLALMSSAALAQESVPLLASGSPAHGSELIAEKGCGACHTIPGIAGANGLVGPPLTLMGRRTFVAGLLRNTPQNLAAWVLEPQRFVPGNAMPSTGLTNRKRSTSRPISRPFGKSRRRERDVVSYLRGDWRGTVDGRHHYLSDRGRRRLPGGP